MSTDRQQRRRRRLTILAAGFAAAVAAVVGLWFFQQARHASNVTAQRDAGLASHEQGDYAAAVAQLEKYLEDHEDDADALFAAADSVFRTQLPGNLHLAKARRWLLRARQVDPLHEPSRDLMLELAEGFSPSDAIAAANDVLGVFPEHPDALLLRARKQVRLERYQDAANDITSYLEQRPDDYAAQLMRLQVGFELHRPVDELIADAEQLLEQHPDDPRYEMVLGMAHRMAGHADDARKWFDAAAQRPVPEEGFIAALVRAYDSLGRFDLATDYLLSVAGGQPLDGMLGLEVTRRLFEAGEFEAVLEKLAELEPNQPAELFAIRAMTQFETGGRDAAEQTLTQLAEHPDRFGPLWHAALSAFYAEPRVVADAIEAGQQSLASGLIHPYIQMMLGVLHASAGDHHASVQYQRDAATLSPSWAAPRLLAAKDFLALRQWTNAEQYATQASIRRPDLIEAHVVRALALGKNDDAVRRGRLDETLDYLARILERVPREERLLLLQVELLTESGRSDEAVAVARDILALDPPASADGLIQLASISRDEGLGVDGEAMRIVNDAYGTTPEVAYAQAVRAAEAGNPEEGLALIEAASNPDAPVWRLVRAAYLGHIGDPRAAELYRQLADDFPDRLEVQRQVLASQIGRRDRQLADTVIDRIKELAGQRSTEWRLERARWFLTGPNPAADAGKAEALLDEAITGNPSDADAYLLRARAREFQGRLALAVEDAQAAQRIRPESSDVALELARYHQAVGDYASAGALLGRLAEQPGLDPDLTRRTASMLALQGDYERATRLLEKLRADDELAQADRLLLARLYAQSNRNADATVEIEALLEAPDSEAVAFAADFFGQTGRLDRADAALDLLPRTEATPAEAQAIRAQFVGRYRSAGEAAELYTRAAEADPTDPQGWVRLAAYHVFQGQATEALAAARRGVNEAGSHPGLDAFLLRSGEVGALIGDPAFRQLVGALLTVREHRDAAEAATRFLADARRSNQDADAIARGLQRLAGSHPDFLPLQTAAAEVYLRLGQPIPAAEIAQRAVLRFPDRVEAAQLLSVALADSAQWDRLLDAAREWRKRAARNPFPADVMIAQAQLRTGQANNALQTLDPYRSVVSDGPEGRGGFAAVYAEALARVGRAEQARQFLQPHLSNHDDWRLAWMRLATQVLENPAQRKDWLETITPLVPNDSFGERLALAEAWWALHWHDQSVVADAFARDVIDEAVTLPGVTARAHFLRAIMHDTAGNVVIAEAAYRTALELDPDSAVARNNLSMLLADAGGPTDEALQLAREAVAAEPKNANYRDTLAYVQAKAGDVEEAIANLEIAIELEPQNPQWRRRLEELLKQSGSGVAADELSSVPTD